MERQAGRWKAAAALQRLTLTFNSNQSNSEAQSSQDAMSCSFSFFRIPAKKKIFLLNTRVPRHGRVIVIQRLGAVGRR